MIDWQTLNYIEYLGYRFYQDDIKGGSLLLNRDLTCASLAIDTFSPVVECDSTAILDFERNAPLYYYRAGRLRGVYYVQDIQRVGPIRYKITAQSAIALLDRGRHMGGIYTGQEAGEVLPDICGSVPVSVKTNLAKQKLYGWLPIDTPRANLAQALFALGAAIRTGLDGTLHAAFLWDGLSGVIAPDDTYREGGTVRARGKVTQVAVTEHQYIEGGESKTLFEGTAQQGDEVTFDGPMYDLQATGFSVLAQGANYAVLSAGSGTLTGREYVHNTRLITRSLWTAPDPKVQSFPDTTLVSLVNSAAVADRLANYYKHSQTVEESVIYTGESCGDLLQLPDPFDAVQTTACLESVAISLSMTLKGNVTAIKGFVPPQSVNIAVYDAQALITESGAWTVPEGVTHIRAVLIGGGTGGSAGFDGAAGNAGTYASIYNPSTGVNRGKSGEGSEGGSPGAPGRGGNILVLDLDVDSGQELVFSIGIGGAGGASNGAQGEDGTDTTLTLGELIRSSAEGSRADLGYIDVISGTTYALAGKTGKKGGKGGNGGESGSPAAAGESFGSFVGGAVCNNVVKTGSKNGLASLPSKVAERWVTGSSEKITGSYDNTRGGSSKYSIDENGRIILSSGTVFIGYNSSGSVFGEVYVNANNPSPSVPSGTWSETTVTSSMKEYSYKSSNTTLFFVRNLYVDRTYQVYRIELVYGTYGSGGGGAANGASGKDAEALANSTRGGDGADALPPEDAVVPGCGGDGGHGGGGTGGGGAGEASATGTPGDLNYSAYGYGGSPGTPGKGSKGARGADGAILLYFGIAKKLKSGPIVSSNRRIILDRLGRRIIV